MKNNSNWMSKLDEHLTCVSLDKLAIPGSHNSFSSDLDVNGGIGPDIDPALKDIIKLLGPDMKKVLKRWSVTQSLDISAQLLNGIRYLDIRVAPDPSTSEPRCLHALYGVTLSSVLDAAKSFIHDHPREVLLIDINHAYCFHESQHLSLLRNVSDSLGELLVPPCDTLPSLESLWAGRGRILFFYEHVPTEMAGKVWPSARCRSPWPDTSSSTRLLDFLSTSLSKPRPAHSLYVSQGILTPDPAYLLSHMQSSLRDSLVKPLAPMFIKWIMNRVAEEQANLVNICIVDFVQMRSYVDVVLGCNQYKYFS